MVILHRCLNGGDPHETGLALLGEYFGGQLPEIHRTKLGKPYFTDSPLHVSVTHTPRHVFVAISETPIGIDAEETDRDIKLSLAEKILSAGEFTQFQEAEDPRLALLKFWVLKEAAGKCTGEGLKIWPDHTDFSLSDPRVQVLHGCLVAVIQEKP